MMPDHAGQDLGIQARNASLGLLSPVKDLGAWILKRLLIPAFSN
jgi:hypothetical protein